MLEELKKLNLTIIETTHQILLATLDGKIIHPYTKDVSTEIILRDASDYAKRIVE